jgi:hypothetical protein
VSIWFAAEPGIVSLARAGFTKREIECRSVGSATRG